MFDVKTSGLVALLFCATWPGIGAATGISGEASRSLSDKVYGPRSAEVAFTERQLCLAPRRACGQDEWMSFYRWRAQY